MYSRLPKKFLHANYKKAWKFCKTTIQTKVITNLNNNSNISVVFSTTVKKTKKHCSSALSFIRRRYLDIHRKIKYALATSSSSQCWVRRRNSLFHRSSSHDPYHSQQYYYYHKIRSLSSASSSPAALINKPPEDCRSTVIIREVGESSSSGGGGGGNGTRKVLPVSTMTLPQFRGVDERAEEFISKFREEMKLEREKSIIDFQEMLARGC